MHVREIVETRAGEVVQIALIGRSKQSFAPGKERLGVETDGCFVEFGFAIKIAPVQFRAPPKIAIQRETACRVRLQSARILDLTRRNRQWLGDGNGRTRLGHQDDHRVAQVYRWRILADWFMLAVTVASLVGPDYAGDTRNHHALQDAKRCGVRD